MNNSERSSSHVRKLGPDIVYTWSTVCSANNAADLTLLLLLLLRADSVGVDVLMMPLLIFLMLTKLLPFAAAVKSD